MLIFMFNHKNLQLSGITCIILFGYDSVFFGDNFIIFSCNDMLSGALFILFSRDKGLLNGTIIMFS
jgi:hypothetical protein